MPAALRLVSSSELLDLKEALSRGRVPPDFQAKLAGLGSDNLGHHFIEQQSRLFLSLLLSERTGDFRSVTPAELERLVRVLAYVRKEDDAIPDWTPGGYADDLEAVRTASRELGPLLERFKHWRLLHQVPSLWLSHPAQHLRAAARDASAWSHRAAA